MLRISRITCKKDSQRESDHDGWVFIPHTILEIFVRFRISVIIEDCPFTVFFYHNMEPCSLIISYIFQTFKSMKGLSQPTEPLGAYVADPTQIVQDWVI